jgi:hypothetical protein
MPDLLIFIVLSIGSNKEFNTWLIKFKVYWASEKPLQKSSTGQRFKSITLLNLT